MLPPAGDAGDDESWRQAARAGWFAGMRCDGRGRAMSGVPRGLFECIVRGVEARANGGQRTVRGRGDDRCDCVEAMRFDLGTAVMTAVGSELVTQRENGKKVYQNDRTQVLRLPDPRRSDPASAGPAARVVDVVDEVRGSELRLSAAAVLARARGDARDELLLARLCRPPKLALGDDRVLPFAGFDNEHGRSGGAIVRLDW